MLGLASLLSSSIARLATCVVSQDLWKLHAWALATGSHVLGSPLICYSGEEQVGDSQLQLLLHSKIARAWQLAVL